MRISVITPSVRPKGLALVKRALDRQTFEDFEWIVVSPVKPEFECVWIKDPPKKDGDYWSVYTAYNQAVLVAKGDLIVSWQDYTFTDPDCLEKFWLHYQQEPKTLVTAVGNKYSDENFLAITWKDPRERNDWGAFYECYPNDIEFNLCMVPKSALYEVGGFDEYMNKYSSCCGLDVLQRIDGLGGYKFYIDQSIKSYSLEHGRLPEWEGYNPFKNGAYDERVRSLIDIGSYPVLQYLPGLTSEKE